MLPTSPINILAGLQLKIKKRLNAPTSAQKTGDKERKIIISGDKGSFIWVNDDLFLDTTHYKNGVVIEGSRKKIQSSADSNLDIELNFFIFNQKPNVNIIYVWELITKINK